MSGQQHIRAAASLRGQGRFREAILEVENNRAAIHPDIMVVALIQAFLAARQLGDDPEARKYAKEIAATDPDLPSIATYL